MPWLDVTEPFAAAPRVGRVVPNATWSGVLDIDRGWAEIIDVEATGVDVDLSSCSTVSISDSVFRQVDILASAETEIELRGSELRTSNLAQLRLTSIHKCVITGCKLVGVDLSGATLTDVVFEQCTLRYANLRMAKLRRVQFVNCTLDDVDCFELNAANVEFEATRLSKVNVDRMKASKVDLRGASELQLTGLGQLSGCLVAEHQLPGLAYGLALAAGLGIEREPEL